MLAARSLLSPSPYRMEEAVMKELVQAVRHDTMGAIENGEKLIQHSAMSPEKALRPCARAPSAWFGT